MTRPSFEQAILALRCTDPRFPWVGPTTEEADAADALEVLQTYHQGDSDETTEDGSHYGDCTGCGGLWPCEAWIWGEQLAALWLGRGYDRYWAHAKPIMDRLAEKGRAQDHGRYGRSA